jgi:D-cysteine desulfhydrase
MSAQPEVRTGTQDIALPPLLRRFPALAERLPWLPLGAFPTPVERLRFERFGDGHWVKRDDLSGTMYGGNKVRKLEWLLAEARRQGAERLITLGAAGSHHALATTAYGRALGFQVTLALFPQPLTPHVREVLLRHHALGAELWYSPRMELLPLAVLAARRAHRGQRCFVVAAGGSDPHGTLGYVNAALEVAEQIRSGALPEPEAVHLAMGTMGTAAGLAIGFALADLPVQVRAVRITSRIVTNAWALRSLVRRTLALLEKDVPQLPSMEAVLGRIHVEHRCIGRGYGHETADGRRAAELFAEAGLTLDPTYTAKAAVAFLDALERRPARPHLFWHTLSAAEPPLPEGAAGIDTLPPRFRRYLQG